ncbi:G/U mismatch-specific uracil-DNA glycosylase [Haloactinospora alba]|uniref:G/U mismatch-specific uracil-DNA glycosylase n=1 Tax=Haloactinospora alba TaxID=405555 RepID=A0A543NJC5_9ACTN|nr:G/U mismatch-specific DNA glycosylase [Haloactinospora alba]TQN31919.1 G/U mismatch-specific uracil-DNA glycosylase [Haloactinospora alba]
MAGPTKDELTAARGATVADVIAPGLRLLFCGINPGLYSGHTGLHFARPGNRFWPSLHHAGLTPRRLAPSEQHLLPQWGMGITNLVSRATGRADELSAQELRAGGQELVQRVTDHRPAALAVLGVTAYRQAFGRPHARVGEQEETVGGVLLWVLPNPSGLNAHWDVPSIAAEMATLWKRVPPANGAVAASGPSGPG